ncbi:hypothetical protein [Desulfovibrio falkowii]|uniref:hypothetical protein n=1 Tax=Desulfovibrio sp. WGS1351 TaxID=3366814 RepID=UPI00372D21E4
MTPTPFSSVSAPDVMQQEIPNFSERLSPLVGRLRLISEYIEYPVNQFEAAAEICGECADVLEAVLQEIETAQEEIRSRYCVGGRVVVRFSTGEMEHA